MVYRKLDKPQFLPDTCDFNKEISEIDISDPEIASKLTISVFVVCISLNCFIDLKKLKLLFDEDNDGTFNFIHKPDSKKSNKIKKSGEDSFYNSLKVVSKIDGNNISGKIFPNGKIQIAGCRTIEICKKVSILFRDLLYSYKDSIINVQYKRFRLINQKLGMINSQFSFNFKLKQTKIKELINENSWLKGGNWRFATYQPGKYPGINAKYWIDSTVEEWKNKMKDSNYSKIEKIPKKVEGQVAVLIFRSGNTIITGAKTSLELKMAYFSIVNLVKDNLKDCINEEDEELSDDDSSDCSSDSDSD